MKGKRVECLMAELQTALGYITLFNPDFPMMTCRSEASDAFTILYVSIRAYVASYSTYYLLRKHVFINSERIRMVPAVTHDTQS